MAKVTPTGATTRLRSRGRLHVMLRKGELVARAWPRKRGKPAHPVVLAQNAWFAGAARLASRVDPLQAKLAIEVTKDTGLLPRDILMAAMAANLYDIELDDGRIITKRPNRLYPVMFQGFILRLDADFTFATGAFTAPDWGLPVRDTAGFWNVTTPSLITIPQYVTEMVFSAGWRAVNNNNGLGGLRIADALNVEYSREQISNQGTNTISISTGPIRVSPGEQYQAEIFQQFASQAKAVPSTYFSGVIVGTEQP